MITNQETQAMHQKPPNSIKPTPPQNHKPNKKGIHYQDEKHGLIALDELCIPGPHRSSASSDVGAIVFDHAHGPRLQSDRLIDVECLTVRALQSNLLRGRHGRSERERDRSREEEESQKPKIRDLSTVFCMVRIWDAWNFSFGLDYVVGIHPLQWKPIVERWTNRGEKNGFPRIPRSLTPKNVWTGGAQGPPDIR